MIVGVDPGASGGIAMLTNEGEWIAGYRMPTVVLKKRKVIDVDQLDDWVNENCSPFEGLTIAVEYVTSFGQGRTSAFNFGRYVGALETFALQWCAEPELVTPQVWKKAWNLSKDKREALNLASVKFPGADVDWSVLANDGIAEAALIALYLLRKSCLSAED